MGKSSGPQTMNTLTPEQNLVSQALGQILHKGLGKPNKTYKGDIVAPLDAGYDQVYDLIDSYNPNAYASGTSDALESLLSGEPAFNLDPDVTEAYFRDAVAAPALRNYQQNIVPQLDAAYAGQGAAFSTRLSQAKGQALNNLNANLTAQLAQTNQANQTMAAQLADNAANRRANAIGIAQQMNLAPLTQANVLTQTLAPFQQNRQAQATADYNKWQQKQPSNNPYLNLALSYIGSPINAVYQPQGSNMGGLIGSGAGMALGAIAAPFTGGLSLLPAMAAGGALGGAVGGAFDGTSSGSNISQTALTTMLLANHFGGSGGGSTYQMPAHPGGTWYTD